MIGFCWNCKEDTTWKQVDGPLFHTNGKHYRCSKCRAAVGQRAMQVLKQVYSIRGDLPFKPGPDRAMYPDIAEAEENWVPPPPKPKTRRQRAHDLMESTNTVLDEADELSARIDALLGGK